MITVEVDGGLLATIDRVREELDELIEAVGGAVRGADEYRRVLIADGQQSYLDSVDGEHLTYTVDNVRTWLRQLLDFKDELSRFDVHEANGSDESYSFRNTGELRELSVDYDALFKTMLGFFLSLDDVRIDDFIEDANRVATPLYPCAVDYHEVFTGRLFDTVVPYSNLKVSISSASVLLHDRVWHVANMVLREEGLLPPGGSKPLEEDGEK